MPQRAATDIATAAGALTSPWWLEALNHGYQGIMAAGALLLLALRLAVAFREWRRGRGG